MKSILWVVIFLFSFCAAFAQSSVRPNAIEIYQDIEKLNFLGAALYVAAHPDDENTRLISYLSKELKAHTAYLSLTRGDGGQNLIGTEIRDELGVIRTQELLMARAIDGGSQFFTRALDFGYSKHPDETFAIWNKKEVLSDVVWVMRNFRPDVIINRFDHRTPGKTHGHHTGSAMLSLEAFDMINDKSVYPEQLEHVQPWAASRLYFNTSWWFYGSREKFAEADKSNLVSVDIGKYDPMSGSSISEIATRSRSKHLSQGFGSVPSRGSQQEYVEFVKGDKPDSTTDIFEGINTTWTRVKGGKIVGDLINTIVADYDFRDPSASLPLLLDAYKKIDGLKDGYWKNVKIMELKHIIESVCGLYLEAVSDMHKVAQGDSIELTIEVTNRSDVAMNMLSYSIQPLNIKSTETKILENNIENKWFENILVDQSVDFSTAYWLKEKGTLGMSKVDDQLLRGTPESKRPMYVDFTLDIEGVKIEISKDVLHKYRDPAVGEVYKPFEVTPAAFVSLNQDVYLFAEAKNKNIEVEVKAGSANITGKLELNLPEGWRSKPSSYDVVMEFKGETQKLNFEVSPPDKLSDEKFSAVFHVGHQMYTGSLKEIEYDHIPTQTVVLPAESKLVRIPLEKAVNKIGYIMGAGDKVPQNLRDVGYQVDELEIDGLSLGQLKEYDAVILGIRIYNIENGLPLHQSKLFEYVKEGGTLITQYNTTRSLKTKTLAPFHIKLSRERVTDEYAKITVLQPKHRVMNYPNKITDRDFENWVQERGLYFPNEWDEAFVPILSCHDKGEDPKEGSLLIAPYGEGNIVYTGLSMFRELPAGVPGAYRLFANMIALGSKEIKP